MTWNAKSFWELDAVIRSDDATFDDKVTALRKMDQMLGVDGNYDQEAIDDYVLLTEC